MGCHEDLGRFNSAVQHGGIMGTRPRRREETRRVKPDHLNLMSQESVHVFRTLLLLACTSEASKSQLQQHFEGAIVSNAVRRDDEAVLTCSEPGPGFRQVLKSPCSKSSAVRKAVHWRGFSSLLNPPQNLLASGMTSSHFHVDNFTLNATAFHHQTF